RDLGSLEGSGGWSTAVAINSRGEVAGTSTGSDGKFHAIISGPDGGPLVDLGIPPGGVSSYGYGMNEQGVVVGTWGKLNDSRYYAFITDAEGASMRDLGQYNGLSTTPQAVNADGNVVGFAGVDQFDYALAFVSGDHGSGL